MTKAWKSWPVRSFLSFFAPEAHAAAVCLTLQYGIWFFPSRDSKAWGIWTVLLPCCCLLGPQLLFLYCRSAKPQVFHARFLTEIEWAKTASNMMTAVCQHLINTWCVSGVQGYYVVTFIISFTRSNVMDSQRLSSSHNGELEKSCAATCLWLTDADCYWQPP